MEGREKEGKSLLGGHGRTVIANGHDIAFARDQSGETDNDDPEGIVRRKADQGIALRVGHGDGRSGTLIAGRQRQYTLAGTGQRLCQRFR